MELRVSSFLDEKYIPSYRDRKGIFSDALVTLRVLSNWRI